MYEAIISIVTSIIVSGTLGYLTIIRPLDKKLAKLDEGYNPKRRR